MQTKSPVEEIFGNTLEDYKFTKEQMIKMIQWASESGGSKDTIRAPWLKGDIDAKNELAIYRRNLIAFLNDSRIQSLPNSYKLHAAYLNKDQQKAYFSLKAWMGQFKVTQIITKGHIKQLLNEWQGIQDKLKLDPKSNEMIGKSIDRLQAIVGTPPYDDKTALNPAFGNLTDEDMKHLSFITKAVYDAKNTNYYQNLWQEFQLDRAKNKQAVAEKRRQKAIKEAKEAQKKKEEELKKKAEEADRARRYKSIGLEPPDQEAELEGINNWNPNPTQKSPDEYISEGLKEMAEASKSQAQSQYPTPNSKDLFPEPNKGALPKGLRDYEVGQEIKIPI